MLKTNVRVVRRGPPPPTYKIYGVSIDLNNPNPETAVTYTDDAIGMTPGSDRWEQETFFGLIRPCIMQGGEVVQYLNPNNFNEHDDGSTSSANFRFVEFPKMGLEIKTTLNTLTVRVTDNPSATGFNYYAHTRDVEGDGENFYVGVYHGFVSGRLFSASGQSPTVSQTLSQFRIAAQANGPGYDLLSFYPLTLIQALFLIRFKNRDSQTALGRGYVDGNSAAIPSGQADTKGMFFGEQTGKQAMKAFGLENLWGNVYQWVDGLYCDANRNILTAFKDFNDTGAGYTNHGQGATANLGGYLVTPQGTTQTGFIAKSTTGGSESTYFTDYGSLNAGGLPSFGGSWFDASSAGLFFLYAYSASTANANLGARLMYLQKSGYVPPVGQRLGDMPLNTKIKLDEGGVLKKFRLNSTNQYGAVCVDREQCLPNTMQLWSVQNKNSYTNSIIDTYFSTTYKQMLGANVRSCLMDVQIQCITGDGIYNTLVTITRSIVMPSVAELGFTDVTPLEGNRMPAFPSTAGNVGNPSRSKPIEGGSAAMVAWDTRTPGYPTGSNQIYTVQSAGTTVLQFAYQARAISPFIFLNPESKVSFEPDEEGYYTLLGR